MFVYNVCQQPLLKKKGFKKKSCEWNFSTQFTKNPDLGYLKIQKQKSFCKDMKNQCPIIQL